SYPSGCGSTYTCTYIKDGGSPVTVTSNPTVYFGANGTLVAKVSDGVSTASASTYSVVRNDLYVSSSGNDTTGYGTINKPYATIQKAYDSANTTATIKIMNDLNISSSINFNASKTITLTSYSTTGAVNTAKKAKAVNSVLLTVSAGALNLYNIVIDGNGIADPGGLIEITNDASFSANNGVTIKNAVSTYLYGGAIRSAGYKRPIVIDGATFINNKAPGGGAILSTNLTLKSGTVSNNTSTNGTGGGIYICGNLTINGGSINENTSTGSGGGIMFDGTVDVCKGTFTMTDGSIYNNKTPTSSGNGGGGILISGEITATISGGSIYGNTSFQGGGIYIQPGGKLYFNGGKISSNTAADHGGGILNWNGTYINGGGVLTGNSPDNII
ncbi:MAG: hypothetical protein ACLR92_06325, partial [Bacilli bacterium]